jgi:hypothetical protein
VNGALHVYGLTPRRERCDCEHAACTFHVSGDCRQKATVGELHWGEFQNMCPGCSLVGREADAAATVSR